MAKILLVEDNPAVVEAVSAWLVAEGHAVDTAFTGQEALDMLTAFAYELAILDWDIPKVTGIDVLRQYRQQGGVAGILMLTGKSDVDEKALALDAGADDYVTKPFHPKELKARIRALLRRPQALAPQQLCARDLVLETQKKRLSKAGRDIRLQPLEFAVLEFFMRHPGDVFSPEALIERVWDSQSEVSIEAIYTCITRLRRKIQNADEEPIIRTVHGLGYQLVD
jgi:OmpR-family two-component system manganese-sensing response regulator